MKVLRFFSDWRLRLCLCLLIVFSIILSNTDFVSNAAEVVSQQMVRTYNVTENHILNGNTYLSDVYTFSSDKEWVGDEYPDIFWDQTDYKYFWYMGEMASIFTTSSEFYGYRVLMERTKKTSISTQNAIESRWICGTPTELLNGANVGNYDGVDVARVAFWVPSNYANVQIRIAPLFRFVLESEYDEDDGWDDEWGSYSINAEYRFTYDGYKTKSEYESAMNDIHSELQNQTEEMQDQTEELQNQTKEMKEQTNTQKGMLSKMSEFFGGFFDNLTKSVLGLFVPSSEEMGDLFSQLNDFFNEKFGFLFFPFDFVIDVFDIFLTADSSTGITFPSFKLMGYTVWEAYTFDLSANQVTSTIFGYVRMVTGSILSFAFISYLRNYFDKRFGGGGS